MDENGHKRRAVIASVFLAGTGGFWWWRYGGGSDNPTEEENPDNSSSEEGTSPDDSESGSTDTSESSESQQQPTDTEQSDSDGDEGTSGDDGENRENDDSSGNENEDGGDEDDTPEYSGDDSIETAGDSQPDYTKWLEEGDSPYVHGANLSLLEDINRYQPLVAESPFATDFISSRIQGSSNLITPVDEIENLAEGIPSASANTATIGLSASELNFSFVEAISAEWTTNPIDSAVMSLDEILSLKNGLVLLGDVEKENISGRENIKETGSEDDYTLYEHEPEDGLIFPFAASDSQLLLPHGNVDNVEEYDGIIDELLSQATSSSNFSSEVTDLATQVGTGASVYASVGADIRSDYGYTEQGDSESDSLGIGVDKDIEGKLANHLSTARALFMVADRNGTRRVTRSGILFEDIEAVDIGGVVDTLTGGADPETVHVKSDENKLIVEIFWN